MSRTEKTLLLIDAAVNLMLGLLLLLFPAGVVELLGLPATSTYFYPSILGAIIFGIGIALLLEWRRDISHRRGLGLAGAIAINLCGSGALVVWLLIDPFDLPLRGYVVLWSVALVVVVVGLAEILHTSRRQS
jgi:hypothetical protein